MFYISKKYDSSKYGVTDTKDGIEKVYSVKDLVDIINKYKVIIKGGIDFRW